MKRTLLYVFLILLTVQSDVKAAWKTSRKSRKRTLQQYQNDAADYGPNVCAIQEVFRTGEKFYPDCIKSRVKRICDRPTFVRYECCCGYGMLDGETGCPALEPLKNVKETLDGLGLAQFSRLLKNTLIEDHLEEKGAFTVFAPIDEAFNRLTHDQKQRLFPWTYNALSLVHYHVVPGWHHTDHMRNDEMLKTHYYGLKPVWVHKSSSGVNTVNCARVIRPNILASNGVVHLIDGLLSPYDMFGNLTDVLFRETGQFSQFIQVLYTSGMIGTIRDQGIFTIFAPNNYAFSRLPKDVLEAVIHEQQSAIALVEHHVARGVYCGQANIVNSKVKVMDGTKMTFKCRKTGHYVGNSKLIKTDMLAGNGVIHTINKIQLPPRVLKLDTLARMLRLNKFLELTFEAGLLDKLQTGPTLTLFAPSNKAFDELTDEVKDSLFYEPVNMEKLFDYLTLEGKLLTDQLIGDHTLTTNSEEKMKVTIYRDGILVDDAEIIEPNMECSNGVIHIIDKVLTPPEHDLMQLIRFSEDLSNFRKGLDYSGLDTLLASHDGQFTVFAPTDQAFNKLAKWQFDELFDDKERVKMRLQHHIVDKVIMKRVITPNSLLRLTSLQGETITFNRGKRDYYLLNKGSEPEANVTIATNGILYKIDRVLDCSCKPDPDPS